MDGNMGILHRTHELQRESTEDSSTHFSTEAAIPTTTASTTTLKSFEELTSTVHSTVVEETSTMLPLENLEDLTSTATTTVFPPSDHEHLASAVTEQLSRVVSHEAAVTAASHTTHHEASLSSMQQQLESLNNQTAIEYLIHRLQSRLGDLGQSASSQLSDLRLPSGHSRKGGKALFSPPSPHHPSSTADSHHHHHSSSDSSHSDLSHVTEDGGGGGKDGLLLHEDTIILVSSMVVMIVLGLILYQIMAYLTKINNRRTMYQSGLRTLGEAMHVVTRSAAQPARDSSPVRPGVPRINTPTIGRKRALCDSPSTARVLREARRGTIFKPPTNIIIRDEDLDGMVCQTVSQQAHFRKLEQIHQREYEQEKLKKNSIT